MATMVANLLSSVHSYVRPSKSTAEYDPQVDSEQVRHAQESGSRSHRPGAQKNGEHERKKLPVNDQSVEFTDEDCIGYSYSISIT